MRRRLVARSSSGTCGERGSQRSKQRLVKRTQLLGDGLRHSSRNSRAESLARGFHVSHCAVKLIFQNPIEIKQFRSVLLLLAFAAGSLWFFLPRSMSGGLLSRRRMGDLAFF